MRAPAAPPAPSGRSEQSSEEQRQKLNQLLEHHQGNVARDLGTSRMQIHRLLQRFGLDLSAFRKPSTK